MVFPLSSADIFLALFFFKSGFGGSFMAPSTTPVTPAQNNLLQPNFEAAFGTTPSTSSSSSFDPSGESLVVQTLFLISDNRASTSPG